jgi:hypothetical protein
MRAAELADSVIEAVRGWEDIAVTPHRFGGEEFKWGRVEIGHVHRQGFVDVPFPGKIRDQLVVSGIAKKHHFLPDSGWVTLDLRNDTDAEKAIELLRLSWDLKRSRREVEPAIQERIHEALTSLGLKV